MDNQQKFQAIIDNFTDARDLRLAAKVALLVGDTALAADIRAYLDRNYPAAK